METAIGIFTIIGALIGSFITYAIFKLERKDKFRLVAIEKRLQAHQEAFTMWYELANVIHKPSIPIISKAREFWVNNNLYLEKRTRKEFDIVIKLVDNYSSKLEIFKEEKDLAKKKLLQQDYLNDWNRIYNLPILIQREVELESIVIKAKHTPEGEEVK